VEKSNVTFAPFLEGKMEKSNMAFPPFLEGKMEEFSHFK
jgi:hypothetical protein